MALDRRKPRRLEEAEVAVRVRRLALAALAAARLADEQTIVAASADTDGQVRRLALMAAATAAPGSMSDGARGKVMSSGFADSDYLVRYEALRIHGRSLSGAAPDWGPVAGALDDHHLGLARRAQLLQGRARPKEQQQRRRHRHHAPRRDDPRRHPPRPC